MLVLGDGGNQLRDGLQMFLDTLPGWIPICGYTVVTAVGIQLCGLDEFAHSICAVLAALLSRTKHLVAVRLDRGLRRGVEILLFGALKDWRPGFVRIETFHLLEFVQGCRAKIVFVNDTIVTHDERSHAGHIVFGRCGDQSKAPDHDALYDKVHLTERGCWALPCQDLEEIAMVGLSAIGVTLLDSASNVLSDWAAPSAVGVLPC